MPTDWKQIPTPTLLKLQSPNLRAYQREVEDGHLSVFVGQEPDGWHLSISHRNDDTTPGRYVTWDELKEVRYRFCPTNITMAIILPPTREYVNIHETTFHLWEIEKDAD